MEKTVGEYRRELKTNFYDVIGRLCLIISKLTRLRCNDWDLMIIELRKKVYEFGFRKTCRKVKINQITLQKILDGNKNINFRSIERLVNFFEIENIER